MVRGGIAQRIEEPATAMSVAPALGVDAALVVTQVEKTGPLLRARLGRLAWTGDMCLPAVDELELRTLAAVRALDEQHGSSS